jgi:hypothetical protein
MSNHLEDKLETILKHVNDWLKFAEQKNATLVALNAGAVWGVSKLLTGSLQPAGALYYLSVVGYILLFASIFVCLTAFFPILSNVWFKPGEKKSTDNAIFFGDIAKYSAAEYLNLLKSKVNIESSHPGLELDYANQITNNASIALDKYKRYRIAARLFFMSVMLFLMLFLLVFGLKLLRT